MFARKFVLGPGETGVWHLLHRKEIPDPQVTIASKFVGREEPLGLLRDLLDFLERSLKTFQGMGSEFEAARTGIELARLVRVRTQPLEASEQLARAR
jgi:hypothetical protein